MRLKTHRRSVRGRRRRGSTKDRSEICGMVREKWEKQRNKRGISTDIIMTRRVNVSSDVRTTSLLSFLSFFKKNQMIREGGSSYKYNKPAPEPSSPTMWREFKFRFTSLGESRSSVVSLEHAAPGRATMQGFLRRV